MQVRFVRKALAEITDEDMGVQSFIENAVDDACTRKKLRQEKQAVMADMLVQALEIDALVSVLQEHDCYE